MVITRNYPHRIFQQEFRRLAEIRLEFFSSTESSFDYQVYRPVIATKMEEQMLYSIVKEELKILPKFSGSKGDDVVKWLKKINDVFDQAQLQSPSKYLAVQSYLTDTAAVWFTYNKNTIHDWSTFQAAIKKAYQPTLDQLLVKMEQRQQFPDEPVSIYYYDKLQLCLQVDSNMSPMMQLHYLTKGLKSSLIAHVLRRQPATTADFLVVAEAEEKIQETLNSLSHDHIDDRPFVITNDPPDPMVTLVKHTDNSFLGSSRPQRARRPYPPPLMNLPYVPSYPPASRRFPTSSSSSSTHYFPPPTASRQCYVCSRVGHIAKYCPNRKNI